MRKFHRPLAVAVVLAAGVLGSPGQASADWEPLVRLSPIEATSISSVVIEPPEIASGGGWQTAAWRRRDSSQGTWVVEFRQRSPEGVWGPRTQLPDNQDSFGSAVGMDHVGNATVSSCTISGNILVWDIPVGGVPSAPQDLGDPGFCGQPQLAVDRFGNSILAWTRFQGFNPQSIMATFRPAGGAWGQPQAISGAVSDPAPPEVGISEGNATVVWSQAQQAVGRGMVDGTWQAAHVLSGGQARSANWVKLADDGRTAVWQELTDDLDSSVWAARWSPAGWRQRVRLAQDASFPDVASNAARQTVASFVVSSGNGLDTLATRRWSPGASWSGSSVAVTAIGGSLAYPPVVGLAGNGVATVVWNHRYGGSNPTGECPLLAARQALGRPWSAATQLIQRNNCVAETDIGSGGGASTVVWVESWRAQGSTYYRATSRTFT